MPPMEITAASAAVASSPIVKNGHLDIQRQAYIEERKEQRAPEIVTQRRARWTELFAALFRRPWSDAKRGKGGCLDIDGDVGDALCSSGARYASSHERISLQVVVQKLAHEQVQLHLEEQRKLLSFFMSVLERAL